MTNVADLSKAQIEEMGYVDFMALLNETNRPPGGKDAVRQLVLNTFLTETSSVLDVGCNTGYCTFEIAHLARCNVTGLDINENMIKTAQSNLENDLPELRKKMKFMAGDAEKLPFGEGTFDLVMSGGSTAFVPDKQKAIKEYARVCKPWGFVGDLCFFYHTDPPKKVIDDINTLLGTNIEVWGKDYWLNLQKKCDLERYYEYTQLVGYKTEKDVEEYCEIMITNAGFPDETQKVGAKKMAAYMNLFNKNHKYLSYGVFISRKPLWKPQISLFGE